MMKGPKGKPEERLRLLSLSSPEETEGRPQCSYNFLMGKRRGAGTDLFTLLTGDRIQGNGWKLCQGQLRLGIRKRFSPEGGGHWNRLPRSTKPDRVQEALGQCSQAHGVTPGDGSAQGRELDSMILMGSF